MHHCQGDLISHDDFESAARPQGHNRYGQHFSITDLCQTVALVPQMLQHIVYDYISRYNLSVVHVVPPQRFGVGTTIVVENHLDATSTSNQGINTKSEGMTMTDNIGNTLSNESDELFSLFL